MNTLGSFQLLLLLTSLGVQIAVLFEIYRMIMIEWRWNRWIVAWLDGILAGIAGLYVFRQMLPYNGGEIRVVLLLSLAFGVYIYLSWIRKFARGIIAYLLKTIHWTQRICNRLLSRMVLFPLLSVARLSYNVCTGIILFFWRKIKTKWLTERLKRVKISLRCLTKFD